MRDQNSVAITGLSCKFPGDGDSLESFWESLCAGKSAWSRVPRERFNMDAFWSPHRNRNTSTTQGAHFLREDVSKFDASFFSIPKNEVEAMDPQHRTMIEVAYEALERAGLSLDKISGTQTGVFMGHFTSDYKEMIYRDPDSAPLYSATGACKTSLANRISWLWDLRGPSITLDTACSSSLVALHLACQSLLTGDSDIAIVGGTSLLLNPEMFMYLSNQAFLSPDGKCKSFDESANGYGRGEGFGCVVLKRAENAISEGDPIRAVIRATGTNQDGHTKGLTLPSADAQAALIQETYNRAGIDMGDTGYVEAHGTGTQAGDVQETEALARTIAASHASDAKLIVGSVKSNIGHLEAAAGIASVIKAVLILENGLIPPNINFRRGNPNIKFDEWNIQIPVELTKWPTKGIRRISTNSFGYGGSNAHAILEDAYHYLRERRIAGSHYTRGPSIEWTLKNNDSTVNGAHESDDREMLRLFVMSAQDKGGIKRVNNSLSKYVEKKANEFEMGSEKANNLLSELAYTLSEKRSKLQWKTHIIASSLNTLSKALIDEGNTANVAQSSRSPRIGFVFTGQGAQWPQMGIELMHFGVFKDGVMAADRYLREECECSWSAAAELQKGKSISQLHLAEYSQALCTVIQVALVDLLKSWNVTPTAVVGHSSGEIAAAYCMGALTRENAWQIAYYRGILSSDLKVNATDLEGSMMAAGLSRKKAEEWISKVTDGEVVVACINSPSSVTISGDAQGIDQMLDLLKEEDIFARRLQVDTAYHSPHMQIVAQEYYELLADIVPSEIVGNCTMHSSVTGVSIEASQLGAINWVKNLTSPVLFSDAIYDMLRPISAKTRAKVNAVEILVEIGPHSALRGPSAQTLEAYGIKNIPYYSILSRNQNGLETALSFAGTLFAEGAPINISRVNDNGNKHVPKPLVDLPSYPWKHSQRYWHESRIEKEYLSRKMPRLSLLGAPSPAVGDRERSWRGYMRLSEEPWIADHKMQGSILYPGAGFLTMALEAIRQTADNTRQVAAYKFRDIQFTSAAIFGEDTDLEFVVQLRPHLSGTRELSSTWTEFVISSSPDGTSLVSNCSGLVVLEYEAIEGSQMKYERDCEHRLLKDRYLSAKKYCESSVNPVEFYAYLASMGLEYGPAFTNISEIHDKCGQSVCSVQIPDIKARALKSGDRPHVIHPTVLDAVFHLAFAAVKGTKMDLKTTMVPKFISGITISAKVPFMVGTEFPGYAKSDRHGFKELISDIVMLDEYGESPVIEVGELVCAEIAAASSSTANNTITRPISSKLTWKPAIEVLTLEEQQIALKDWTGLDKVTEYLKLIYHSKPALSILEFVTDYEDVNLIALSEKLPELRKILSTGSLTIASQDLGLKTRLHERSKHNQNITFEHLDLNRRFSTDEHQNDRAFDVIISSGLNSDTERQSVAIANMTRLLKKDGKMCILETDDYTNQLQNLLRGLHINTIVIHNLELAHLQNINLLIAQQTEVSFVNGTIEASEQSIVTLIQRANLNKVAQSVVSDLTDSLEKSGHSVYPYIWGSSELSQISSKFCISLLELEKPILQDISRHDFNSIQQMILQATKILWVVGFDGPGASMVDGLARTVRNEMPGLSFSTLHTPEHYISSASSLGAVISRVYNLATEDNELLLKDDLLHVSRVDTNETFDRQINEMLPDAPTKIFNMPLGQVPHPTKLCIRSPGMLDSLYWEVDNLPSTELENEYIEIRVKATALNFREVMVAMGQIADSKLGFDAAGIVHRVGSAVTKFKVGDRVAMFGHGAHRSLHRSRADYCSLIPEELSFEQAASIPTVYGTAWNALVRLARVQKGQSILIHAAAGGVGLAAIQMAKYFEMEIFATVSSDIKRKLIRDQHGILDDHIFNSRDLSFVKGIKRMTNNRGVDVVLNSLSGEMLQQTWYCIAPFGHFIEIGLKDILGNTRLDMRPFMRDTTFSFFNLNHIETKRPDIMALIIEGAFDLLRRRIIKPIEPLITYPVSDIESAFRLMQTGKHIGKVALAWGDDHVVPVAQIEEDTCKLDPNGVYMLAGGLGGLGTSLSSKLVDLGARKLCFLSRSDSKSVQAEKLTKAFEDSSVEIRVYKCDIAEEPAVAAAIKACQSELGDIRGVVQCAMVLRDTLFMNMSYEEWAESTRPKVQGSWNLHQHLPHVDFFVSLSSFAAIFGNRGQSNYAAAGAFEDALAYYRRAQGQHAITLDLGIMRDVGILAENGITDSLREWEKPYGLRETEFHALLERAIAGDMAQTLPPQILTGLATGGSAVSAGIDMPFYLADARFSIMKKVGVRGQESDTGHNPKAPYTLISHAKSLEEAAEYVLQALMDVVAKMLRTTASEIDVNRFLHSYGIDSLVAIEIVNWALKQLKSSITVFDVLAGLPITTLSQKIAAKSTALPKEFANV